MRFAFSLIVSLVIFAVMSGGVSALQNINSCRTLDVLGETYVLQNNVSSNGTCFTVTADNITLDLNGYTVTYANLTFDPIYNGDFEIQGATPQEADGWDQSQAPNAQRALGDYNAPYTSVFSGNYSISIAAPTPTQTIKSSQPVLLQAGVMYTVGVAYYEYEYGDDGYQHCRGNIVLDIVDEFDNLIKSIPYHPGLEGCSNKGFMFFPRFDEYPIGTTRFFSVASDTNAYIKK